jgi:hypothetical protein
LRNNNQHLEKLLAEEKEANQQQSEQLTAVERGLLNTLERHDEEIQTLINKLEILKNEKKVLKLSMVTKAPSFALAFI